jgi:carbamoyltransferase
MYYGTGRLQTVDKEVNNKYWILINEFKKLSGYGVLLNTSFNINSMPLVKYLGMLLIAFINLA